MGGAARHTVQPRLPSLADQFPGTSSPPRHFIPTENAIVAWMSLGPRCRHTASTPYFPTTGLPHSLLRSLLRSAAILPGKLLQLSSGNLRHGKEVQAALRPALRIVAIFPAFVCPSLAVGRRPDKQVDRVQPAVENEGCGGLLDDDPRCLGYCARCRFRTGDEQGGHARS
jgi:hypothetical protein